MEDRQINIAVTIIKEEEKWIFEQVKSIYGRANAIKNFFRLFKDAPGKQEYILNQLRGKKHRRYNAGEDILFTSKQEQMLKYALSKENYPYETQRAYEAMFCDSNSSKHKNRAKTEVIFPELPLPIKTEVRYLRRNLRSFWMIGFIKWICPNSS